MLTGYWISQSIYVAAKLNIADTLVAGPRDAKEIAAATGADPGAVHRLMRALASVGVFSQDTPGCFGLAPLGELLRTDRPGSMRSLALMYGNEQFRSWGDALHSVNTGEPAFPRQFGMDYFDYLEAHPDSDEVFNEAMGGITVQITGAVTDSYEFGSFATIVDVGGSYGALLTAVLRSAPHAHGILFDQPHVIARATEHLAAAGIADRCTTVGGDFFVEVPAGGDAYVLSQIIHDWDDERCIQILGACRRAINPDGRLIVVDFVLPETNEPSLGKWLDLHMLVLLGARERTAEEFRALFAAAGFELTRIVPTMAGPSVVEARPR
jgi:hypothetical protein